MIINYGNLITFQITQVDYKILCKVNPVEEVPSVVQFYYKTSMGVIVQPNLKMLLA